MRCPRRRTRETVEIVKAVLAGEQVRYHGKHFDLVGFHLRFEPPAPPPMFDAAGMGPKAVELAGRFADGWHAMLFTPRRDPRPAEGLPSRCRAGGRDRAARRVTLSVPCCALDDAERARRLVRRSLAFYLGAMGTYYRDSLARQGYEELAHEVAARWGSGDREAAAAAIPDALLDDLAAAGTPERTRERLERFAAIDGVDAVSVVFPRDAGPNDVEATLAALAP